MRQLRDRLPMLVDPPSDDLCYAAQNRQNAVKAIVQVRYGLPDVLKLKDIDKPRPEDDEPGWD